MKWQAGPGGSWRGARNSLGVRRGTKATWQNPGGPHGAQQARSGAATWQDATRSRGPRGRPCGAPRGEDGKWRAHGYSGPW